ncbi:MAG: hypothetical protein IKU17_03560 [Clostridia bacterium]|nr:hypothetical protein [Clostridia bacterium]
MAETKKPIDTEEQVAAPAETAPKKWKLDIGSLFFNNRFVFFFSLICALIMWVGMAVGNTETRTRLIYNVPIEVVVADDEGELTVFSKSHSTATVSVEGSSVIINRISANDVQVVATLDQNANVMPDAAGGVPTYQLAVTAQKKGNELADFEVVGCTISSMTVKADTAVETTFRLTNNGEYKVASGCYVNAPLLSADTVTIAGPRSIVDRIHAVNVNYVLGTPLSENHTLTAGLTCVDEEGKEIARDFLKYSLDTVDVRFNVYARKTLELQPVFLNMPAAFPKDRIKVTPATVEVAGTKAALENLETLTLETVIDFTDFTTSHTSVPMDIVLPTGFRNIDDSTTATVSVDLKGYTQGTFDVSHITIKNASSNQYVDVVTESLKVSVVGPVADITRLTANSFYCVVDLTNTNNVFGTMELPVTVEIHNNDTSWVVGSYTVNLQINDTPPDTSEDPDVSGQSLSEP